MQTRPESPALPPFKKTELPQTKLLHPSYNFEKEYGT